MRSGWHPGPPPRPPQFQLWWGPGPQIPGEQPVLGEQPATTPATVAPAAPVRIGDAERDEAVSALGDHFAAGRLNREEFDERADLAMQARFSTDLDPLFADLPKPAAAQPATETVPMRPGGPPPWAYAMWLLPFVLVAAIVGSILLHAPFVLWVLVWFVVMGKIAHHRRRYSRSRGQFPSRPGPR